MREKDKITDLFRHRLTDAEMTVQDDFWEGLQRGLSQATIADGEQTSEYLSASAAAVGRKRIPFTPRFYRVVAAASVAFVLGAASAAFWYFSPKEEIKEAFTQAAAMTPEGSLNGDIVQENFPSIHQSKPTAQKPGIKQPVSGTPIGLTTETDEESVSLHVSITFSQRVYSNHQTAGNGYYVNQHTTENDIYQVETDSTHTVLDLNSTITTHDKGKMMQAESTPKPRNWALKAAVGTSLPKSQFDMPFTAELTLERRLNNYFSLETGLQYHCLPADRTLHTLAVPVQLNAVLASTSKIDFYATVGGAIEKCIAGVSNHSFKAEPVQLSVAAGVGVRYKMNDRFALFAEPSVSHHFDTDSQTKSLRTERPVNLNLLCGVRMTY